MRGILYATFEMSEVDENFLKESGLSLEQYTREFLQAQMKATFGDDLIDCDFIPEPVSVD